MKRALDRDYSVVDGYDAEHRPVKGVTRISWVPPTKQDYEDIAKLGQNAVPVMADYFKLEAKPGGFEQLLAVHFLAEIGTPSTIAPLGAALSANDWQVARLSALDALGELPNSDATTLIRSALNDKDPQVSQRAKAILALRNQ